MSESTPPFSTLETRYARPAVVLHWLIAVLVLSMLGLGAYMSSLSISPLKIKLYLNHKSLGMVILLLMLFRIAIRVWKTPPPLPAMPRWQQIAAHSAHALLYCMLVAMPLSGWLMNSATGFPLKVWGIAIPALIAKDPAAFAWWQSVHHWLGWTLAALIALHVLAVLKHTLKDKMPILTRMRLG